MTENARKTDRALDLAGRMAREGASKADILAAVAKIAPPANTRPVKPAIKAVSQ